MGYFELNIEPKKIYFIKVIYIDFTTSIKFQLIDIYKGLEDIKKSNSKPIEPFNTIDSEERKELDKKSSFWMTTAGVPFGISLVPILAAQGYMYSDGFNNSITGLYLAGTGASIIPLLSIFFSIGLEEKHKAYLDAGYIIKNGNRVFSWLFFGLSVGTSILN